MKQVIQKFLPVLLGSLVIPAVVAQSPAAPHTQIPWAYGINTPGIPAQEWGTEPQHVPGSSLEFVFPRDRFSPPDWHPQGHPPMPEVVAKGREPGVFACAFCHLPNGQGKPENASLAGQPADYMKQQIADYRAGLRISSEPDMQPPGLMLGVALSVNEAETQAAADYFSSLPYSRWLRVIETDTVPETVVFGFMHIEKPGGGVEPIGNRIIEMPESVEQTELRNDASSFIAYVPTGSIAKGRELASGTSGVTQNCTLCHGQDLRGLGPVPALAGRSPSYLARQLNDFRTGSRKGLWSPLMQQVVAQLGPQEIVALTAWLASLEP